MRKAGKYLQILLWLIAIHTFVVGCLLILLGNTGIMYFGFPEGNPFFQVQGGIFHIVMGVAYILAAMDLNNNGLIVFIIIAKTIAFAYLMIYYALIDPIITLLLAGLADGMMAALVAWLWKAGKKEVGHE